MHLETGRLSLRPFEEQDAKQAHALFCDEEAMRLAGMYPPLTRLEQTQERIRRWAEEADRLAIVLKDTGALIGYIAVKPDSEEGRDDTKELGFALIADYRGRGYMKEAVNAVLEELARRRIAYVWACCFRENAASEGLIRSLGFEFRQAGSYISANDREYESLEFVKELKGLSLRA